ncbi:MAG: GNAT family N-acetyltransferase [Dehalococcoidia bacterium]
MERELPRPALARARQTYHVRELQERGEIAALLNGDRSYAAYALGQLEQAYFTQSRWWRAQSGRGEGLVLHSRGGLGDAVFVEGDAPAIDVLLSLHPGPVRTYVTCRAEHLSILKKHFFVSNQQVMMRMAVDPASFQAAPATFDIRRLRGPDVRDLNHLYGSEGATTFYNSWHIDDGVYFGVYEGRRLVAAAGTHVVAPAYGVAVVGNVFTHPGRRGRGFAKAASGAVTAELLRSCRDVVLTVDPGNLSAVAAYHALGYREQGRLIEAAAVRKDLLGLAAGVRRWLARRRGHADTSRGSAVEVVTRRDPASGL